LFIPYDAIAILAEVKSQMTKTKLENDLKKLTHIGLLNLSSNRFSSLVFGSEDKIEDRPFRLLVYFDLSIDRMVMEDLLDEYSHGWDAIFLINNEEILINKSLKVITRFFEKGLQDNNPNRKFIRWGEVAFIILLLIITRTAPIPLTVDVIDTFLKVGGMAHPLKS
jgi:hypothetical protein